MALIDIFIKVQVQAPPEEKPERLAAEICRQVQKVYGVRTAELVNYVRQDS